MNVNGEPNQIGRVQAHSNNRCFIDSTRALQIRQTGEGEQFLWKRFSIVGAEFETTFQINNFIFSCARIFQICFQNVEDGVVLDSSLQDALARIACF